MVWRVCEQVQCRVGNEAWRLGAFTSRLFFFPSLMTTTTSRTLHVVRVSVEMM